MREKLREDKNPEIEVTPAMVQAGATIYLRETDDTLREIVRDIYRAMERVRRRTSEPAPNR